MWFLILVIAVCLVVIIAWIAILIKLWRKGGIRRVISTAIAAGVIFLVYSAIYPHESFYKEEFERVTRLPFPASGKFLFKEATYPDFHGDYTSCALLEVSEKDYEALKSKMRPQQSSLGVISSQCLHHLFQSFSNLEVASETYTDDPNGEYNYWALVASRPAVIIHYVTW